MEYKIKSIDTGFDQSGYKKTTHVITFWDIHNSIDLKSALGEVEDIVYDELWVEHERSQFDCTGRYSTSEIERVHRSFSHGTLLVIYNEFGSYDI